MIPLGVSKVPETTDIILLIPDLPSKFPSVTCILLQYLAHLGGTVDEPSKSFHCTVLFEAKVPSLRSQMLQSFHSPPVRSNHLPSSAIPALNGRIAVCSSYYLSCFDQGHSGPEP